MTTYTLQGIGVDFADVGHGVDAFLPSVTLQFTIINGAPVFSYTVISSSPGDADEVQLNTTAINANIDGVSVIPENPMDETFFVEVQWNDNGVTRTTYVLDIFVPGTDFDYLFVVGGDAFPTFATGTAFEKFLANDVTSLGGVTSGPFAPNTNISIPGIAGVTVSEDDNVVGTSGNDVIDTGIGNDTIDGGAGLMVALVMTRLPQVRTMVLTSCLALQAMTNTSSQALLGVILITN